MCTVKYLYLFVLVQTQVMKPAGTGWTRLYTYKLEQKTGGCTTKLYEAQKAYL